MAKFPFRVFLYAYSDNTTKYLQRTWQLCCCKESRDYREELTTERFQPIKKLFHTVRVFKTGSETTIAKV